MRSMVRIGFGDMVSSLASLLIEQLFEILCGKRNNLCLVGRIFLNDCLGVMLEDVGELIRYYNLFCAIYSLFSNVSHASGFFEIFNLYNLITLSLNLKFPAWSAKYLIRGLFDLKYHLSLKIWNWDCH